MSRIKEVDLVFFYFSFSFLFSFRFIFYYSIFRTRVRVMRSCCHTAGPIRWHSHKSHDTWKEEEGSEKMTLYNIDTTYWPYGLHMVV